jgi:hypothetical protein
VAYNRIFWKDRIVIFNDDGTINKVIQEGTPLSAFNLNRMDEGILKTYYDVDFIKKNQLELLISRDLDGQRVTMDEGYWFDTLKNEDKIVKFLEKKPTKESSIDKEEVINDLTNQREELMKSLAEAFEAKCNGEIPPSVYSKVKEDFDLKLKDINAKIDVLNNDVMDTHYDVSGSLTFIENIKGFNKYSNITRTILTTIIDKIEYTETTIDGETSLKFEIYYQGIDWLVKDFGKIINN